MEGLVEDAMEHSEEEQKAQDLDAMGDADFGEPRIVIVGCGGAGNNTVNRLYNIGVDGAETIALNTDKQHLESVEADKKLLVGKSITEGLGAGGDPSQGERATEMAKGTIKEVIGDADLVFVTAGMGGGTGTGAAPIVSKIASEQGAIVVGMVSTPFKVERARVEKAEEGLYSLQEEADSVIVLDNERLLDYVPNLPVGKAFSVMDQIIAETVKGISETITQPSLINLDYADMTTIMGQGGVAVMLVGDTQDKNKEKVVDEALNHPLLDVDYRGATGGLVHITGGPNLSLNDANSIAEKITERLEHDANVIWGARLQDDYQDKVRVMAIMTGVDTSQMMNAHTQKAADKSREASKRRNGDLEQDPPSQHGIDRIS